jgi:hypothetical protein
MKILIILVFPNICLIISFMDLMTPFDILYRQEDVHVVPRKAGKDIVFVLHFPGRRPPLMLTRAKNSLGKVFWTTIPEERDSAQQKAALDEAEKLGALIQQHYT